MSCKFVPFLTPPFCHCKNCPFANLLYHADMMDISLAVLKALFLARICLASKSFISTMVIQYNIVKHWLSWQQKNCIAKGCRCNNHTISEKDFSNFLEQVLVSIWTANLPDRKHARYQLNHAASFAVLKVTLYLSCVTSLDTLIQDPPKTTHSNFKLYKSLQHIPSSHLPNLFIIYWKKKRKKINRECTFELWLESNLGPTDR
jgi:hypothetical protein